MAQTTPIDPDDNSSVVKKMMALLKRIETLAQSTDATRLTPTFFEEPLKKMFMKSVANPRIASFYSKRLGCPVNASTSFEEAKRMVIEGSKHHHLEKRAIVIEGTTKGILGISSGVVGTILVIIALVAFGLGPLGLAILGFYFLWLCLILAIYK